MKSTGIVRRIDELGRIVIPKELRKTMDIEVGTPIEISVEGDSIILNKYEINCVFCGRTENDSPLVCHEGKFICKCCIEHLKS
ncbi:MAG: AbrB/MazE/SpoVT family DNA-binding domain-containing protein [Clostridiales bacterium]|nr:AbrB/MazE/SpoVT family DNA-binding domain-containing protein [Clostridiales bacterium]